VDIVCQRDYDWRLNNMSGETKSRDRDVLQGGVISHAVLVGALLVALVWLVPRFYLQYADSLGMLGGFPQEFLLALNISYFCRANLVFIVPAVVLLLWLDGKFYHLLLKRVGRAASSAWSIIATTILVAVLLWNLHALSSPGVKMYEWGQREKAQQIKLAGAGSDPSWTTPEQTRKLAETYIARNGFADASLVEEVGQGRTWRYRFATNDVVQPEVVVVNRTTGRITVDRVWQ
jgi:hypothetical protein